MVEDVFDLFLWTDNEKVVYVCKNIDLEGNVNVYASITLASEEAKNEHDLCEVDLPIAR